MSLKRRLERLEQRHLPAWEAPWTIILTDEDAARAEALREEYREEIERDRARGRTYFGVDFRCHELDEPEAAS